ncbi:spore germination protein PA/spore germination protein PF [Paenibacillus sp. BK033]|uniref:spore germination protein n=1 Tax=Paenibacillus sp. BK033 TaxID=2512133 RepID=UPI001051BD6D|nr:spore germination protein [Paenibacillus sp. BK033]TCM99416.1 spore germination protein PA/spore germination protein PF [Paenibacillus sp. BK033]
MPTIVGMTEIVSVGSGSVIQVGDSIQIKSTNSTKTYAGAGSFLTGSLVNSNNAVSATNTNDPDYQDNTENEIGIVD